MKISHDAAQAILHVMMKHKLSPKTTYLEIGVFHGHLGMAFTRDKLGKLVRFGALAVVVRDNVDAEGVVIDLAEIDGRKGLIFLGENDDRNDKPADAGRDAGATEAAAGGADGEGGPRSQKRDGRTGLHD